MHVSIHSVLGPVEDLEAAVTFYRTVLGMEVAFQDGDRYASFLPAPSVRLALTRGSESVVDRCAMAVQVDDIADFVALVESSGGRLISPVEHGPHERRAVVADPSGNPIVVAQKD